MNDYRKSIDGLPLVIRILLALPFIDGLIYGIYRICRGDTPAIILGVIWIFIGGSVGWIVDIVMLALGKTVWELSDADVNEFKDTFKSNHNDNDNSQQN